MRGQRTTHWHRVQNCSADGDGDREVGVAGDAVLAEDHGDAVLAEDHGDAVAGGPAAGELHVDAVQSHEARRQRQQAASSHRRNWRRTASKNKAIKK